MGLKVWECVRGVISNKRESQLGSWLHEGVGKSGVSDKEGKGLAK